MPKKSFRDELANPAELFISKPVDNKPTAEITTEEALEATTEGLQTYRTKPASTESRSKRLQLLVQPSVYEKIKAKAQREGRSVNDMIHLILEESVKGD